MAKRKKQAQKTRRTVVTTQSAVAKHFNVSTRAIWGWLKRLDPMPGARGNYVLEDIEEWRAVTFSKGKDQQVIDPGAGGQPKERSDFVEIQHQLQSTKLRKENALATQNEIRAKRMDDEFIPLQDVCDWIAEFLTLQRNLLTAIPVDMFASAPDDQRKIYQPDLMARINIHLNQMGDYIERVDDLREAGGQA